MGMTESDCPSGAEALLKVPPNSSVPISYHPLFGSHDDLLLLELDEKLLPDVINQRVSLRGQPDEDAVFCTQSKTYAIKFVGTSNSLFLVPPSNQYTVNQNPEDLNEIYLDSKEPLASVLKLAPGTMELVEVAPKIDKLKSLLSENTYKYDGNCNKYDTGLYRWDDLIDRVQASDEELRSALRAFSAVEIDGYWRIIDEKYMYRIRSMLINNSLINDWSLNALDENEVVESLVKDKFSRDIAHHCLEVFGTRTNGCEKGGKSIWSLDKTRVCVHIAREILARGKMKMESFMEEWTMEAPSGMVVSLDLLEGEVLVEKLGIQSWVYAFSVSSLPSDPANRFARLFQERSKWDWKDLHPYIRSY
nr:sister chromatid cohesion protein DCC1 [Tanacetum cinerariifolium]